MRNTKEVYKVKDWKDWDHNYNLGLVSWSQRVSRDSDQQNDDYVFKVENKDPKTFQDVKVFGGKNFTPAAHASYRNLVSETPNYLEEWKVNTHTWSEFQYWAEQTLTWLVQAWKQLHGKSYPTQKEDRDRMKIWMENKVMIEKHNQEHNKVRKALYYVIISFTTLREFTVSNLPWTTSATSATRSFLPPWREANLDQWRGGKTTSWWCQRKPCHTQCLTISTGERREPWLLPSAKDATTVGHSRPPRYWSRHTINWLGIS